MRPMSDIDEALTSVKNARAQVVQAQADPQNAEAALTSAVSFLIDAETSLTSASETAKLVGEARNSSGEPPT
jgi:outer membrane protein TolC